MLSSKCKMEEIGQWLMQRLQGLYIVWTIMSVFSCSCAVSEFGMPVGCYNDDPSNRDLPFEIKLPNAPDTVELCADACLKEYYRFAGLQNAAMCFCGNSYGEYGIGACDKLCHLNSTQPCGGAVSNNVYDTGQRVPGPPTSLEILNIAEASIQVGWTMPRSPNGVITTYQVSVKYVETYSMSSILPPLSLTYTNATTTAELLNLHPGTKYNISVAAYTADGRGVSISKLAWTLVGEPAEPEVPVIIKRDKGQMVVKLAPVINDNGPVTSYRIVVVGEGGHASFVPETLTSWTQAQHEGQPYYIAAEITPEDLTSNKNEFVVGDGRTYGQYYNPPLPLNGDIHISIGVVSSLEGNTRVRYAHAGHEQHGIVVLDVGFTADSSARGPSATVVVLSVAIGIFGFLLVLSVVTYFVIRRKLGRRRRLDHQELSLQGPMIPADTAYDHQSFVPEEEEEDEKRVDYYEKLKHQVWNIPRNFLDVRTEESLGKGIYGEVSKGTVQQRGFPQAVTVYTINDRELSVTNKRFMLQDLDVLIRAGPHDNLVGLIGTCESPETLFVVLEYHPASLKDIMLESRCLEYLTKGTDQTRFCSLGETQVLEAALGVARAMSHLTRLKVVHKQLLARNVLMADGIVPKVTGHGISKYDKGGEIVDNTRWMAQEIFRSRHYVNKSDVWAFGCLLWELTALGGTPYASVRTSEIGPRVMRGMRLPQFQFVGDDLYQLMLQCWQLDLDERPSFEEIEHILENLVADPVVHINFSVFDGFHYEPFIAEFERKF